MVKIKYVDKLDKLQYALKESNKNHVVNKNLHEIKQVIFLNYTGDFEMVGKLSLGDQIRETINRFRIVTAYESYFNAIDEGYEADDAFLMVIFIKYLLLHLT